MEAASVPFGAASLFSTPLPPPLALGSNRLQEITWRHVWLKSVLIDDG